MNADDQNPDPDDPTAELPNLSADPTTELDPTTSLPSSGAHSADPFAETPVDPDRVDQAEVLRFMARRLLLWGVPLVLIGILLVALGLPAWIIAIALAVALAIVVFEIEL